MGRHLAPLLLLFQGNPHHGVALSTFPIPFIQLRRVGLQSLTVTLLSSLVRCPLANGTLPIPWLHVAVWVPVGTVGLSGSCTTSVLLLGHGLQMVWPTTKAGDAAPLLNVIEHEPFGHRSNVLFIEEAVGGVAKPVKSNLSIGPLGLSVRPSENPTP
jgi:hypothetical protein